MQVVQLRKTSARKHLSDTWGMPSPQPPANTGVHDASRAVAELAGQLIDSLDTAEALAALLKGLRSFVEIENLIVFSYRQGFAADLVFTSLDFDYLALQMAPYTSGLYLLDPFYIADTADGVVGLVRLEDVAPEDFRQSEFYLQFYEAVNVLDELHFIVRLEPGRSVHVFVEREARRFDGSDVAMLAALEPLVSSFICKHWQWRDRSRADTGVSPIHAIGGIEGVIRNMRPGQLTPRESEVIGLSLRGHSSKLIAHQLGISEGTVTNHKRNVYEKLGIHSQSQLFSLFLTTLAADSAPPA